MALATHFRHERNKTTIMSTAMRLVKVNRVKDAIGPWPWRKSQALHEKGSGHKVVMVAFEDVVGESAAVVTVEQP